MASKSKLVDIVFEESQDTLSNDSCSTVSIFSSSISTSGSMSFSQITSTPSIVCLERKSASSSSSSEQGFEELSDVNMAHFQLFLDDNKSKQSEDEFFADLDFLNMLNCVEQKISFDNEEKMISSNELQPNQKKRKLVDFLEEESGGDALEKMLSNKRSDPIVQSQVEPMNGIEFKEPFLFI